MMKAIVQTTVGGELVVGSIPSPEPGCREIKIKVHYSSLNRMDLIQAKGLYPVPSGVSEILGVEVSGTVVSLGSDCQRGFSVGDTVMALLNGGGYAEYCVVDERTVMNTIPNIPLSVSAAIPEAFMTSHQLLFFVAQLAEGESVLLHAASSSIGQAAIQLAVRKGIKVFATARSDDKCARCLQLGATAAFKVDSECRFGDAVRSANNGKGVNAILDPVGGSYLQENLGILEMDGRIVFYGLMGGGKVDDPTFLNKIMARRLSLLSSTLRTRTPDYKASLIDALTKDAVFASISNGDIKVEVSGYFPLEQAAEAHQQMGNNQNIGKLVLVVSEPEETC